jgi:hypothetical protein
VFLSPSLGEGIENTKWVGYKSNHKPWDILFITYLPPHTSFCWLYSSEGVTIHNVISKNYHMSGITLISRIDWLFIVLCPAQEGLQNVGLCSALRVFEQGGIFIVPHLLWHGTSVFPVSSEGPPHSVASYDTQGMWRIYSNPDSHGSWYQGKYVI